MQKRAAVLAWILAGSLGLPGGVAWAEAGDHVRFGSGGVFTPSLSVAGVYRTNNYLTVGERFGSSESDATVGGLHLNIRPQLALDWKSKLLEASVSSGYDLRKYFAEELLNLDRYGNYNGRVGLNILPSAVVGLNVDSAITVTGRETEAVNSEDAYLQQLVFRNTGSVAIRPGEALELDIGGSFELRTIQVPDGFVQNPGQAPTANLNAQQSAGLFSNFHWQFLPKTAIVANFERYRTGWESNQISASGAGVGDFAIQANQAGGATTYTMCDPLDEFGTANCFLPVPDGVFTHFDAGIRGRFTEKLILGAVLGFTRAEFDSATVEAPIIDPDTGDVASTVPMTETADPSKCGDTADADGVNDDLRGFPCTLNGNIELRYDFRKNHSLISGFLRRAQPMFFTNYLNMNRYYVGYTARLADRHVATFNADFNQQNYRGQVVRNDLWFRVRGDVAWGVQKWLTIDTGVWYTGRRSADGEYSSIEYDDINLHGGFTLSY